MLPLHQIKETTNLNPIALPHHGKRILMREYTAKYNTKTMVGVEFSFKAENFDEAIDFAAEKFGAFPEIELYDDTDTEHSCEGPLVYKNGEKKAVSIKKYSVYYNNNVECNKVAEFDTLDEAKAYCVENTKDYDEIGDGDNCYEGRSNNFHYEVYEGDSYVILDEDGDVADFKTPVYQTEQYYCN